MDRERELGLFPGRARERAGEGGEEEVGRARGPLVLQGAGRRGAERHGRTSRGMAPVKRRGRGADREGPHVRDLVFSRIPFSDC